MPSYSFHLEDGDATGDVHERELADDKQALREAAAAAGEALLSELAEGRSDPQTTVTVERDGVPIARVTAQATVEHLA